MKLMQGPLVATVMVLMLCASGCTAGSSQTNTQNKTLTVDTAFNGVMSADPARGEDPTATLLALQMYQLLLVTDYKDHSKLDPALAASYVASPDGLSVTYNLRHNVRFSDGSPMTSADVVFSLNRWKYIGAKESTLMNGLTVTAPDAYTVIVNSSTPNAAIARNLTYASAAIVNSKVLMANGGSDATDANKSDTAEAFLNQQSVGSGPYILGSLDPAIKVVLKVNPNYWQSTPAYSTIVLNNVPPSTQALEVQRAQNTVSLDLTPEQAAGLDKSKVNVFTVPSSELFLLTVSANSQLSPVTANKDFRSAIRYGVDYQALLPLAGLGAVQGQGLVPTGWFGALPADQAVTRDVTKAKAFLASSGQSSQTVNLTYSSDNGAGGVPDAAVAQSIQSSLKDVGINVTLVPEPSALFATKLHTNQLQIALNSVGPSSFDSLTFLIFAPGHFIAGGWAGFNAGVDPALDAVTTQLSAALDPATQLPLIIQYQQLQNADAVFIPLFHASLVMAASKSVGGLNWTGVFQGIDFSRMT